VYLQLCIASVVIGLIYCFSEVLYMRSFICRHPTSCCSAAEIMSTLFFYAMKYKVDVPRDPANDRFVLSKVRLCTWLITVPRSWSRKLIELIASLAPHVKPSGLKLSLIAFLLSRVDHWNCQIDRLVLVFLYS